MAKRFCELMDEQNEARIENASKYYLLHYVKMRSVWPYCNLWSPSDPLWNSYDDPNHPTRPYTVGYPTVLLNIFRNDCLEFEEDLQDGNVLLLPMQ